MAHLERATGPHTLTHSMNATGKPVPSERTQRLLHDPALPPLEIDFDDTRLAFAHRSDEELRHARRLFRVMNNPRLVGLGSRLGAWAVRWRLPLAERVTLDTIYRQFVGGRTLLEVEGVARALAQRRVLSILDYGAEGKNDEAAYNLTMTECIRAMEFASQHESIPVVTTKISGLASDELLASLSSGSPLTEAEAKAYRGLTKRVDSLCHVANERGVQLYIDAEESWMQPAIDKCVTTAMLRYNRERAVIVNTFQLYRHDRLAALRAQHEECRSRNVVLGAKLVRGAYLDKERERAAERGYPDPIQPTKAATDRDFDAAVDYCLDHLDDTEFVNASHNQRSAQLMIEGMARRSVARDHPHTMLCQLYGMSDNLTFNLAEAGYRVGKYLPYGPVRDVVPYLVRRARENSSVTGEASRELRLIEREFARRASARQGVAR